MFHYVTGQISHCVWDFGFNNFLGQNIGSWSETQVYYSRLANLIRSVPQHRINKRCCSKGGTNIFFCQRRHLFISSFYVIVENFFTLKEYSYVKVPEKVTFLIFEYINPFVPNAPFLYLLMFPWGIERVQWEQMG